MQHDQTTDDKEQFRCRENGCPDNFRTINCHWNGKEINGSIRVQNVCSRRAMKPADIQLMCTGETLQGLQVDVRVFQIARFGPLNFRLGVFYQLNRFVVAILAFFCFAAFQRSIGIYQSEIICRG